MMRLKILLWMDGLDWSIHHGKIYRFWEWVVMPKTWGGRLGLKNWIKWAAR